jgi:regulator of protease activity HflC (stomatin/prohibitin superfamily)
MAASILFFLLIALFLLIVLWNQIVITIPAGHGGVMWYRFLGGTATTPSLREGVHFIFPWDKLYIYNLRLQSRDQVYEVVSEDGLHFSVTMTFRWQPFPRNLTILHQKIGPEYVSTLLIPEIGSVARHVIAQYSAVDFFSNKRQISQTEIYNDTVSDSLPNGIGRPGDPEAADDVVQLNDILIKVVQLPSSIRSAIERKLEQQQIAEEYVYRVNRERLESDRKAIEADGIRRFQEIVSPAITESYLKWRGISATLDLARSPNAKVVVIGNGPGGLPIILNSDDPIGGTPSTPAASTGTPLSRDNSSYESGLQNDLSLAPDDTNSLDDGSFSDVPTPGTVSPTASQ